MKANRGAELSMTNNQNTAPRISGGGTIDGCRRRSRTVPSAVIAAVLAVGLTGCGAGGNDAASIDALADLGLQTQSEALSSVLAQVGG